MEKPDMPKFKFHILGAHEGKTVKLDRFEFVNGVHEFEGSEEEAALVGSVLASQYQAFREDRLDEAREKFDEAQAKEALKESAADPVQIEESLKHRRIAQRFLNEGMSPVSVYGDGEHAKFIQGVMAKIVEEDPLTTPAIIDTDTDTKELTVAEALTKLDAANDADWTARGVPSVDAVSKIIGRPVQRAEIEAVAPDLTRTIAKQTAATAQ